MLLDVNVSVAGRNGGAHVIGTYAICAAIAALKGPFVGQRGAQHQIFKWPPDYLYIVLVLVGVE